MAQYQRLQCQQCGSVEIEIDGATYVCKRPGCGFDGPTSKAGRYHGSHACDFELKSQSVPRRNKRRQKGQKKIWKADDE